MTTRSKSLAAVDREARAMLLSPWGCRTPIPRELHTLYLARDHVMWGQTNGSGGNLHIKCWSG